MKILNVRHQQVGLHTTKFIRQSLSSGFLLNHVRSKRQKLYFWGTKWRVEANQQQSPADAQFEHARQKHSKLVSAKGLHLGSEEKREEKDVSTSQQALYGLRLVTSLDRKSGLSSQDSGVQVAILGSGSHQVILRTIWGCNETEGAEAVDVPSAGSGFLGPANGRFQRGDSDEVWMVGPTMDNVEEVWLAPVTGSWRPEKAYLFVVNIPVEDPIMLPKEKEKAEDPFEDPDSTEKNESFRKNRGAVGTWYEFCCKDSALLGGKGECSASKLLPVVMKENINVSMDFSQSWTVQSQQLTQPPSLESVMIIASQILEEFQPKSPLLFRTREESLREYTELKKWLLQMTLYMVTIGSVFSFLIFGAEIGKGFAFGGSLGVLYLLKLQNTVDKIQVPEGRVILEGEAKMEEDQTMRNIDDFTIKVKSSVTNVALACFAAAAVTKLHHAGEALITPIELLAGLAGFLCFKLAVVSAVLRPNQDEPTNV